MSDKATPHSASGEDPFGQQVEVATPCNIGTTEAAYIACIEALSPEEQKRTIRRIDIRLVSTLGFLYCISLMDRNNTGIAMIAGMSTDLAMTGSRYSVVVLLFFIPYVLFQPPSTAILRKVEPRLFLSLTTLVWGLTTIASGLVKNWKELIPLRLVLGACEAGFFPGEYISIKKHAKLVETLNDARLCIHP